MRKQSQNDHTGGKSSNHQVRTEPINQLIDACPVAMAVLSGNEGYIKLINRKFIELFGYTIENIPDMAHWWTLAYPDEKYREEIKAQWNTRIEQAIRNKSQVEERMETMVTCKDGSHRYVEFSLSSIGKKHLVTFVNLTERKQAEIALRERERHSQSLLRLSRTLEQAQTYSDVLNAAQEEVRGIIGYQNLWAYLFTSDKQQAKVLFAKGPMSDHVMSEDGTGTITIQGDHMMEEFLKTAQIQVIEDAQIDERTDKNIAVKMRNRTLVHVPILLFDQLMGSIGMGTFGDEGIRVPTAAEREYLVALASHMAVTLDRIHLLERRNQVEQELIAREREFRTLAEHSPDNIARYDANCRTIYVNPTLEKTLGRPASEMLGTFPADAGFIVEAKEYQEKIVNVLKTGKEDEIDLVLPDMGEGLHYHNIRFVAERGSDGTITGVQAIGRDITERKRADGALRASENRFRVLSETAFVGIYIIQDGRLSYVNSTLAKIFGYTPEELTSADPALVIHPDDQAMVSENIRRRIVGEVDTVHYEFRGRCKDGETKNIEVFGGRIDFGGKTAVIGNLMDITERKRAEKALRESERRLIEAQRIAHVGYWERNFEAGHMILSDEACRIFGLSPQEVPINLEQWHQRWLELIHPEDRSRTSKVAADVLTGGPPYNVEYRIIRPGGEMRFIHSEASVRRDESGRPRYMLGMMQDITERKQAEKEIRRLNQELEQRVASRTAQLEEANKELEAFAYSVSHDLRAPLRHVDGFIDMLQKRTKTTLDDKSQHYMEVIADSARKMGALIDDLLSFSRMGHTEMFKSQVDLDELVQDVIEGLKPETEGRDIQWKISPLPLINGDRAMLRVALVNLISNALKFTRSRKVAQIEIGCERKDGTETVIFIRDNGVGFDINYADKLFGVFQRMHRQEDFEGTGIGLANVRRVIHRHGGRTWADGQVDHGATFYFSLPTSR